MTTQILTQTLLWQKNMGNIIAKGSLHPLFSLKRVTKYPGLVGTGILHRLCIQKRVSSGLKEVLKKMKNVDLTHSPGSAVKGAHLLQVEYFSISPCFHFFEAKMIAESSEVSYHEVVSLHLIFLIGGWQF